MPRKTTDKQQVRVVKMKTPETILVSTPESQPPLPTSTENIDRSARRRRPQSLINTAIAPTPDDQSSPFANSDQSIKDIIAPLPDPFGGLETDSMALDMICNKNPDDEMPMDDDMLEEQPPLTPPPPEDDEKPTAAANSDEDEENASPIPEPSPSAATKLSRHHRHRTHSHHRHHRYKEEEEEKVQEKEKEKEKKPPPTPPKPVDPEEERRDLLLKFAILRKANHELPIEIPEYAAESDLGQMRNTYTMFVKHISVNSRVDMFKSYLVGGFVFSEFILGRFCGLDMSGFATHQMSSMSSYDNLLVELGEKTYVPKEKQWPVELRLVGMVLIQVALFIGAKQLMKRTGSDILGMMGGMTKATNGFGATGTTQRRPKPKMRGPDLNDDD